MTGVKHVTEIKGSGHGRPPPSRQSQQTCSSLLALLGWLALPRALAGIDATGKAEGKSACCSLPLPPCQGAAKRPSHSVVRACMHVCVSSHFVHVCVCVSVRMCLKFGILLLYYFIIRIKRVQALKIQRLGSLGGSVVWCRLRPRV